MCQFVYALKLFSNQPILHIAKFLSAGCSELMTSFKAFFKSTRFIKTFYCRQLTDLNLLDYFVWAYLKTNVCIRAQKNLELSRASIVEVWDEMSIEMLPTAADHFSNCSKFCIDGHKSNFDKL